VPTIHSDTYPRIDPLKADLSGKTVLITGASKGIGRATALSFAKAGASGIAILARSDLTSLESEILEAAKEAGRPQAPKILRLKVDATDRKSVEKAAADFAAEFDSLDFLINNAGYLEEFHPLAESDPDEWWWTFEVNIKGVYLVTRSFLPLVLKSKDKTVIMMSSIGALVTFPGASAYQTTKTTILRLNNYLMAEYGDQGLLAYGIHPGGVPTELALGMPEWVHGYLTDTPELAGDFMVYVAKERPEW
jgi:NAD(P)-dependent dehydrogenase (short-subunit alcohol dehydrogenase family)